MKLLLKSMILIFSLTSAFAQPSVNRSYEGVFIPEVSGEDSSRLGTVEISRDFLIFVPLAGSRIFNSSEDSCKEDTSELTSEGYPKLICSESDGDTATISFFTVGGNPDKLYLRIKENMDDDVYFMILNRKK